MPGPLIRLVSENDPGQPVVRQPRVVGQTPHERLTRGESDAQGIDEALQIIGGDPYGRNAGVGLRIPALPLVNATPETSRYLFLLSLFTVARGKTARLRGYRQLVKLGKVFQNEEGLYRPVEFNVTDPQWHPVGGNISWHLMDLGVWGGNGIPGIGPALGPLIPAPIGIDNFAWRMSSTPALLFETATLVGGYYVNLTAYTPPNGGRPWGVPLLEGGFGSFYDLRTPWTASQAWHSLDVEIVGPKTVGFFASVRQADTSAPDYALTGSGGPPGGASIYGSGLPPEEAFLVNFPTANYWRIGGALVVEE